MNYRETVNYLYECTPVFEHVGASAYKEGLDNTHALDTLRNAHRLVEYRRVGGDIHATNVIGGMRNVGYLHPSIVFTILVLDVRGVDRHHLIEFDALVYLAVSQ